MELTISPVTLKVLMPEGSMRILPSGVREISAPMLVSISSTMRTSSISGRFSKRQLSPESMTAGIMARAAFLAPLIVTAPSRRFPPFIL